jgi:hypothetical protein
MQRRSKTMFDNSMTGAVGFAMHEARLATATRNLRLAEAEQESQWAPRSVGRAYRAITARALMALAARIAPPAVPRTGTQALAR